LFVARGDNKQMRNYWLSLDNIDFLSLFCKVRMRSEIHRLEIIGFPCHYLWETFRFWDAAWVTFIGRQWYKGKLVDANAGMPLPPQAQFVRLFLTGQYGVSESGMICIVTKGSKSIKDASF